MLFDTFPDGADVLGGAPFNVAWHLQGLGMNPLLVSRVGADRRGDLVLDTMRDWDMDVSGVQQDQDRPTGMVRVSLQDGQPSFDILPDQAYDHIDTAAALHAAGGSPPDLLYHGTLALREPVSRATLFTLRARLPTRICVDINLRAPWWNEALASAVMQGAHWLKLNDGELRMISGADDGATLRVMAELLASRHGIAVLPITMGERGAFILDAGGCVEGATAPVARVVDTVGAGDAFSAVALTGLLHGWDASSTLQRALEFAAWVCGLRGATVADNDAYGDYRKRWGL